MLLENVILRDTRALQPAATVVGPGTLYCVSDEANVVERSNGAAWEAFTTPPGPADANTLTGTTLAFNVVSSSLTSVGVLAALTVTALIVGGVTGNAATATALATPRAINGVNFDGTAPITVTAAAGTLTGTLLDASLSANVPLLNAANVFSVAQTITRNALAGVPSDALILQNTTPSTALVPNQQSPAVKFLAHVWNTTTVADQTVEWRIDASPFSGTTAALLGRMYWRCSINGAAYVEAATLHSNGNFTLAGNALAGSAGFLGWSSRSLINAPADGQVTFGDNGGSTGIGFNFLTDGVLKVRNRAQSAYGTVDALAYQVSATPLASSHLSDTANIPLLNAANVFSVPQKINVYGIAAVNTIGLSLENLTPATAAIPVQGAPTFKLRARVWNTTTVAEGSADWSFISLPASGTTAALLGRLTLSSTIFGVTAGTFTFDSTGSVVATGNVVAGAAAALAWSGRSVIKGPADGQINFTTNAGTVGVGFDVATDAIFKIRTRAQSGYATVDALAYRVSGVAIDTEPAGFFDAGNSSTALTLNLATSRHQRLVLTGNVTLTLSNPVDGARYVIHIGTGAGSFTVTWPAAVLWPGGITPTITATASKVDMVVLIYNGTSGKYLGAVSQAF